MSMRFDFSGKHVFITGGSTGIGESLVCAFAQAGAKVAFTYRSNADSAAAIVARWTNEQGVATVSALHVDLVNSDDAAACIDQAVALLGGKIDIGTFSNVPRSCLSSYFALPACEILLICLMILVACSCATPVINNAANTSYGSFLDLDLKDWETVFAANVTAPFIVSQRASRVMISNQVEYLCLGAS
jgi:NAD(P)-dependent dehydrogenase (short-subunit alcohol dehydrogenase family)